MIWNSYLFLCWNHEFGTKVWCHTSIPRNFLCWTAMFPTSSNVSFLLCRSSTPKNFTTCWRQLKVMRRKVRASSPTSLDTSSVSWVSPGTLWKVKPPEFTSERLFFCYLLNLFTHWWFFCPQKWHSWAATTAETQKRQKQTTQLMWVKSKLKWLILIKPHSFLDIAFFCNKISLGGLK